MSDGIKGVLILWGIFAAIFGSMGVLCVGMWFDEHAPAWLKTVVCVAIITALGFGLGLLGAFK